MYEFMGLHMENKRQLQINREESWAQEFNEKEILAIFLLLHR